MKLRSLVLSFCALVFVATAASAAAKSEFGLNAGVALPSGDLSDGAGTGFFGGATYTYHVSDMFGLGGDLNYVKFGKKTVTVLGNSASSEASIIPYGVHAKYYFKLKTKEMPYLKVGLGLYSISVKASDSNSSATLSDSKFGFNVGAGADWALNDKTSWGVEALYHNVSAGDKYNNATFSVITVGARYSWMMN